MAIGEGSLWNAYFEWRDAGSPDEWEVGEEDGAGGPVETPKVDQKGIRALLHRAAAGAKKRKREMSGG